LVHLKVFRGVTKRRMDKLSNFHTAGAVRCKIRLGNWLVSKLRRPHVSRPSFIADRPHALITRPTRTITATRFGRRVQTRRSEGQPILILVLPWSPPRFVLGFTSQLSIEYLARLRPCRVRPYDGPCKQGTVTFSKIYMNLVFVLEWLLIAEALRFVSENRKPACIDPEGGHLKD
jgi:hypothetical protein